MIESNVVVVCAVIDTDGIDRTSWVAVGQHDAAGLVAAGDSFDAARANFAEVAALAHKAGQLGPNGEVEAVRVIAQTRKTYPIDKLHLEHQ